MKKARRWTLVLANFLLLAGVLLLGIYIAARIHSAVVSRAAIESLKEQIGAPADTDSEEADANSETADADSAHAESETADARLPEDSSFAANRSHWSRRRIKAYKKAITRSPGTPLALLRIPRLRLEVPVLEGTNRLSLNGGVGRIRGTALPGETGNIGIAGHRDGFFRDLKNLEKGDIIELLAAQATEDYVVDKILITTPEDNGVLRSHERAELTLVTCYPFYFVGPAPKRFIVHASLTQRRATPAPLRP